MPPTFGAHYTLRTVLISTPKHHYVGATPFHCSTSGQERGHELQSPGEKYRPSRNSRPFFRLAFSSISLAFLIWFLVELAT